MSRKFVRGRNICWRWTRVVASSSKFLPSSRELVLLPLRDEKRDSSLEQIRSAFSHSDDLRRLATFSCKKIFPNSRVWIERSSSSPPGRRSPEIRFAGTSSSSSSDIAVGSTDHAPCFYLPRGARCPRRETGAEPAFGKLIIGRGVLPRKFCAQARFRLHLLLMGFRVVLTPGHH